MINRRIVLLFLGLFCFSKFIFSAERIVTIESARSTEYMKQDGSTTSDKTEIIRFSGAVMIVVTEGSSVSRIGADEIIYNKTRDTLEAHGHVTYNHTAGKSGAEIFTGNALLFNIGKQEGVFLGGSVKQDSGKKNSDPLIVHAEVSGSDSSTTMAFKNGILTTCDAEEPHWSINASRIWLLPGNEIALFNGVFFIGPMPVFYIPFFYYPSDEMIVHPVFGFRNREGYFVQTTTYLYGRKPLPTTSSTSSTSSTSTKSTGTSFTDFMQGDTLKEQKRNGLFLENLKEDAKNTNPDYLKLIADSYSTLGSVFGLDGSFTSKGFMKSLKLSGLFGFSRTLYAPSSGYIYSSYDSSGDQHSNSSNLFGYTVPFRYRTDFSMQINKDSLQLSASIPLVSDQEFKVDFMDRSEDLNWFKMLTEQNTLAKGSTISDETSYSWNLSGSYHPDVSFAGHWLNTFNLSNFSTIFTFNSKTNSDLTGEELLYAPGKTFFYPEILKPSVKLSIGGSLFSSSSNVKKKTDDSSKDDLGGIENPFSQKSKSDSADVPVEQNNKKKPEGYSSDFFFPLAGSGLVPDASVTGSAFDLLWSLDPTFVQETRFNATDWYSPKDIKWNEFSSLYYQFATTAKLTGNYSFDKNFFSTSSSLNFTGTKQDHTKLSGSLYDTASERNAVKVSDDKANAYALSVTESASFVPFNHDPLFKPTALSWNFNGDIYRSVYDDSASSAATNKAANEVYIKAYASAIAAGSTPTDADTKASAAKAEADSVSVWKNESFKWSSNYISAHTFTTILGIAPGNYEQKIKIVSNLPPLLGSYTGTAGFAWKFGTLDMSTRLYEQTTETEPTKWIWDPFKAGLAWNLPYTITLGQEYTYSIQDRETSRLNFTGGISYFSLYYTLTNTLPYKLEKGTGWVQDGTENKFIPTDAGCTFNNTSKPLKLYSWKNRIFLQTSLFTDLKFNLVKITESSFDFKPALTLKFNEFLDVTFSSYSSNEVIARYFQQWLDLPVSLPGERNVFVDLYKSMNFFNTQDRKDSAFKLKTLNLTMTHYLHDWTMNLSTTIEPILKYADSKYYYEFIPTVIFLVQWKPVSDIKTKIRSKEGVFSLNASDATDAVTTTDE